jgi:hypothetical protein
VAVHFDEGANLRQSDFLFVAHRNHFIESKHCETRVRQKRRLAALWLTELKAGANDVFLRRAAAHVGQQLGKQVQCVEVFQNVGRFRRDDDNIEGVKWLENCKKKNKKIKIHRLIAFVDFSVNFCILLPDTNSARWPFQ